MRALCDFHGLFELIRESIRQNYLLDLFCTDIPGVSAKAIPYIVDHAGILKKNPISVVLESVTEREMWLLNKARWDETKSELSSYERAKLRDGSAEEALTYFLEVLWYHCMKSIPRVKVTNSKNTHPWLNERSKQAILRKNNVEGIANLETERRKCTEILNEERQRYVQEAKDKMNELPRDSKRWWRLNQQF